MERKVKRKIGYPENVQYIKPFYKVEDGFGYEGVILTDQDTGEIQCHACGRWFHHLGQHVKEHKLSTDEYRRKYGLNAGTALVSEKVRNELVKRAMTFPWERLRDIHKHRQRGWRKKLLKSRMARRMEFKNKQGTCTLQLVDRMMEISKQLGRQPTIKEMKSSRGTNIRNSIYESFGGITKMREILNRQGFTPPPRGNKYSDDILLESIRNFTKAYGRRPSYSDVKRGLMLGYSMTTFQNRFGSWTRARQLAFA